ncbi:Lipase (class 3) [Dyella sp. OK004]|uniref:XVIPCD domain-containing protein n=1 Tax=Dyella sp. OK004 TaxID=1855292 RepID=UPI0008E0084E|nr:XVIPCD domain-containing protein [Dyella sp. OK004]SFR90215.1 Lipase (class 3) [Dyella sp. OK004]
MTLRSMDYAELAKDAYNDRALEQNFYIDSVQYKAIAHVDRPSGYQGTAYQRIDTGEIVIASRGTEFGREPLRDGVIADGGMVFTGYNSQADDAMDFAKQVTAMAKDREPQYGHPLDVTVTGHSLGGTLAEITAYRLGLHGETFNAYGAAGLLYDIPEGGSQVIDHVRATDFVSAASRHFGEVRVYATQEDIDQLTKAGYRDDGGPLSLRNPIKGISFDAHRITNFAPDNQEHGASIMNAEDAARYRAHHGMIDRYRDDIMLARTGLSVSWELPKAIVHTAEDFGRTAGERIAKTYEIVREVANEHIHQVAEKVKETVHRVEQTLEEAGKAVGEKISEGAHAIEHAAESLRDRASHALDVLRHPGSWFEHAPDPKTPPARLDSTTHPDHSMYRQVLGAVHHLDAQHRRAPDQLSDNLAATLVVAARRHGMEQIDLISLSDDRSSAYAIQGDPQSPFRRIAEVSTQQAVNTSVEQSSLAWVQAAHEARERHAAQIAQEQSQSQAMPGRTA